MAGSRWSWSRTLAVCCLLLALWSTPKACWAKDFCELTVCRNDGELELKLHGECEISFAERWNLTLSTTVPGRITSEDGAYANLALAWDGEDWRWTASGRFSKDSPAREEVGLTLRGVYARPKWRASVTASDTWELTGPDGELTIGGFISGRFGSGLSLSYTQDYADVVSRNGSDHYQRYASCASLSWRGRKGSSRLELGGTAHRGIIAIDDERTLFAALSSTRNLGGGWSLAGGGRLSETVENTAAEIGRTTYSTKFNLTCTKRAPVGLKLQTEYLVDDYWRGGVTVSGKYGRISWRAGTACELASTGLRAAWPFAVAGWRAGAWEATVGLTPAGEFAANSRQGYWVTVAYVF